MPTMTISLPTLHPGQREVWQHGARFHVLACGRRWGKSRMGSLRCIVEALRGGRAWWVAPSYPMAAVGWRMLKHLGQQVPGTDKSEVNKQIEFPGGGWVQVRSADKPDSLRGEGLDFIVMDECAFIKEDAWTEALRPALSDRQGRSYFISTPKGRNWFHKLHQRAQNDGNEWQAWHFTSYDNPYVDDAEIDAAKTQLPESVFRQEFLAEFIEDAGLVFRRVMDAASGETVERAQNGRQYIFGVDWAKSADWTVITVVDVQARALVCMDRFNQIDYQVQLERLHGLYERFQPQAIIAERNSMGEPLLEQLQRRGLPVRGFQTTNATKAEAVESLALAFEQGDITIMPDDVLIGELQAYELERLPSGMIRYNAPAGMHDDCVMSLALAWHGLSMRRVPTDLDLGGMTKQSTWRM